MGSGNKTRKVIKLFSQSADAFLPITNALLELYSDEVDVYWFAKSLTDMVRYTQKELPKLKEAFLSMLEKEDGELYM